MDRNITPIDVMPHLVECMKAGEEEIDLTTPEGRAKYASRLSTLQGCADLLVRVLANQGIHERRRRHCYSRWSGQ